MLKGIDLAEFILKQEGIPQNLYTIKRLNQENAQSKVHYSFKKTTMICLSAEIYDGTSPDTFKTVVHELGHFMNNRDDTNRAKQLYTTQYIFWGSIFIFSIINIILFANLFSTNRSNLWGSGIISILAILLGFVHSKQKQVDEQKADERGFCLLQTHLANAVHYYTHPFPVSKILKECKQIFDNDKRFHKNYTYFIGVPVIIQCFFFLFTIVYLLLMNFFLK